MLIWLHSLQVENLFNNYCISYRHNSSTTEKYTQRGEWVLNSVTRFGNTATPTVVTSVYIEQICFTSVGIKYGHSPFQSNMHYTTEDGAPSTGIFRRLVNLVCCP